MKSNKNSGVIISITLLGIAFILAFILLPIASKNNTLNKNVSSNQVGKSPTFINTVWRATNIKGSAPVAGTAVTVQFDNDGRVIGFDGCNNFNTTYTVSGSNNIKINSPMVSTLKACTADIMAQADLFNKLLLASTSYRLNDGILTLNQGNSSGLTFSGSTNSLAKTSWDVTGYNNGKEAVVSPILDTNLTMVFGDDGTISGNAGCNNYTGKYSLNGESITISQLSTTKRMCVEPEGIMEQESSFLTYLEKANTFFIQGNQLSLRTAQDQLAVSAVSSLASQNK